MKKHMLQCERAETALIESKSALQKAKTHWEKLFNSVPDMVTILDENFRIVRFNSATGAFFQLEEQDLIGRHCYELFTTNTAPCEQCPVSSTLHDETIHSTIITHDKLDKIFHVSSAPIVGHDKKLQFIVHTAKDITREKRLETEIAQLGKMEAIGSLASGIAHEFNNILTSIIGFSDLAKIDINTPEIALKDINGVIKGANRAKSLIKQILTFSRKGGHKLEMLYPQLILKESLVLLRSSIPSSVEIIERIEQDCWKLRADPEKLQQILINLCTNGVQAMPNEKGVLEISLRNVQLPPRGSSRSETGQLKKYVELEVRDSGIGMNEAIIERIFEPFFTTRDAEGYSGMGLAVVDGIVRDYGGFIEVTSAPGNGSVFRVYFPVMENGSLQEEQAATSKPLTGKERILLVDDEKTLAMIQKISLEKLGYTVSLSFGGTDALEKLRQHPSHYDLLITDQTMPEMTGIELIRAALKIRPGLPVILCTGFSAVVSEKSARQAGAKAFILKPFDRQEISGTIRSVLDHSRGECQ